MKILIGITAGAMAGTKQKKSYYVRDASKLHTMKFLGYLMNNDFISAQGLEYNEDSVLAEFAEKAQKAAEKEWREHHTPPEIKAKKSDAALKAWETRRLKKQQGGQDVRQNKKGNGLHADDLSHGRSEREGALRHSEGKRVC